MKFAFPSLRSAALLSGLPWRASRSVRPAGSPRRPYLALAPTWLTVVKHDWQIAGYRIRYRLNGECALEPSAIPAGEPSLVILESTIPFRRKLQGFPANEKSRQALLKAAVDEFPLASEQIDCALGIRGNDGYVYALPREQREALVDHGVTAAAILVAQDSLSDSALLTVTEDFARYGPSFAIGGAPRFISRHSASMAFLSAFVAGEILLLAALAFLPNPFDRILEWEKVRLVQEAGDLQLKHANTNLMLTERQAVLAFRASPEAQLPVELSRLISITPPGHSIQRIEYKDGLLKIAGTGDSAADWFANAGFPSAQVSIEASGTRRLFRAEVPLATRN